MNTIADKVEFTKYEMNGHTHYRKQGLRKGFFFRYFEYLNKTITNKETFYKTNDEYLCFLVSIEMFT